MTAKKCCDLFFNIDISSLLFFWCPRRFSLRCRLCDLRAILSTYLCLREIHDHKWSCSRSKLWSPERFSSQTTRQNIIKLMFAAMLCRCHPSGRMKSLVITWTSKISKATIFAEDVQQISLLDQSESSLLAYVCIAFYAIIAQALG